MSMLPSCEGWLLPLIGILASGPARLKREPFSNLADYCQQIWLFLTARPLWKP